MNCLFVDVILILNLFILKLDYSEVINYIGFSIAIKEYFLEELLFDS